MEADSAVIVTVIATGVDTTRPLGWVAVTVTYGRPGEKVHLKGDILHDFKIQ